jgi:membrane-associated phospholipid phosphatase
LSTVTSPIDAAVDAPTRELGLGGLAQPVGAERRGLPGTAQRVRTPTARRTRWWVEVLTVVWLCWVYDAVTNLAPLRLGVALAHGSEILATERTLGIAPEQALDRWLAGHHALGVAVSYYYDNAHFIVTLGLLGYLWLRRADIYRPLRNSLVLINVLGFVVFWRYPVAPPRMLGGFTDVVAASHTVGSWHTGALASNANQLAAMPSLHIAWAAWCAVAVWRLTARPAIRALGVLYPFLTGFAVLATGNHYVLDILGGAILTAVAVAIVAWAPRARARWRPAASGEPAPA